MTYRALELVQPCLRVQRYQPSRARLRELAVRFVPTPQRGVWKQRRVRQLADGAHVGVDERRRRRRHRGLSGLREG